MSKLNDSTLKILKKYRLDTDMSVFGNENKLELITTPFEMKDATGHIIKGKTFSVKSVDENGQVYECQVKPFKSSDKALLNMLF